MITKDTFFKRAIMGSKYICEKAEIILNTAIKKYGVKQEIAYPDTGYFLPCITAWYGINVRNLGDLPGILRNVREKIRIEPVIENALTAGEATMVAAEIIESTKYIKGLGNPYTSTPYYGFIPDNVIRKMGFSLVDDTIPGIIVLLGKGENNEILRKIIHDAQNMGILIIPSLGIISQMIDAGIDIGKNKGMDRMLFCVGDFTQVVHALSFAIRVAMTYGGIKPGERKELHRYISERLKVIAIHLGEIDNLHSAVLMSAIFNAIPVIVDRDIEPIPSYLMCQKDYTQIIQTSVEIRNMHPKLSKVNIPVAYGPAFEGETIRKEDMFVEAGGMKTQAVEFLQMHEKPDEVTDGKIMFSGKDVHQIPEKSSICLGIFVDVYGEKMQKDFEPVIERRFHQYLNFVDGLWHAGQRNFIWIRLKKTSVNQGLKLKHIGDILYTRIRTDFDGIITRVQVKITTDENEINERLPEIIEIYKARDRRLVGLTDESVDTFYTCTLCQSFAPGHVCVISPERMGLCGSVSWLDAKASYEITPTGPNQPVKKGKCVDDEYGEWDGVNKIVEKYSHGKINRVSQYSLMRNPMTSCGCFECIVAVSTDLQGVIVVNREYTGMTPVGMSFSTLAGAVGGGAQTPGFLGIARRFIISKKFIMPEGGIKRIVWMPKELKDTLRDQLIARATEMNIPELVDKIADETITTDANELEKYLKTVNHPALELPPLM